MWGEGVVTHLPTMQKKYNNVLYICMGVLLGGGGYTPLPKKRKFLIWYWGPSAGARMRRAVVTGNYSVLILL